MSKTILSIDDSPSMLQMVRLALEGDGHRVLTAPDGMAGLATLKSQRVDLVITDLNMPRLDGIGVVSGVRADPSHRGVPILVLTTVTEESKRTAAKAAGATGWIVKPFDKDKLLAVVRKLLG